ncbi:hypothetical protein Acsp03_49040 [Actinomadura sp. NBRC 104412]|nr:hypothetical protein Acsp03_49040 [Actinomadura sp. NBRC 104412]
MGPQGVDHMDLTLLAAAGLGADGVLADPGQVSWGLVLITPLAAAAALLLWLTMTRRAAKNPRRPDRRFKDQDNHRGPEQGGYYRYTPGAYSHNHSPGESTYNDENR